MDLRRARGDRGLTLPILVLVMSTLIIMVATAVDLGRQRADRRLAQSGADAVALDMIRIVEGRTLDEVVSDPDTVIALSESAERNDFGNAVGSVVDAHTPRVTNIEWGELGDDEDGSSFVPLSPVAGVDTDLDGTDDLDEVPTAVRITAERTTDYFFQPGEKGVTRLAIATEDKRATFQLGTRLASVDTAQAALLNTVLGQALGGVLNVSVLDYQGLVGGTVNLGDLAADLGFGSPDELADATVNASDLYLATAQVMADGGNTAAASVFNQAAATVDSNAAVQMGDLLDFEQGGPEDQANASIDAFTLLQGSAYAINGTSTLSVPSLAVTIPNVASTSLALNVTEQMKTVTGRVGATGSTRQASTDLQVSLNPTTVAGLRISGTVVLHVEIAGGTGRLSDIDCGRPGISVGLAPRPVHTTSTVDLDVSATVPLLGTVKVADVVGNAANVTTQGTSNGASFDHPTDFLPDVGTGTMVASNPTSLGVAGAANVTTGSVTLLGIPLGPTSGAIVAAVNTLLNPVLTSLDTFVVNNLSTQLGLNLGGADIGAVDMTCRSVKLVG
jgi:uncharacterized membrane protein